MTEADFLDYEPSRLRLADMNPLERISSSANPFITLRRRPHRSIASARERLQSGHGIGMVMLCALGQMHDAEHHTTWQTEPRRLETILAHGRRSGMSTSLDSGE